MNEEFPLLLLIIIIIIIIIITYSANEGKIGIIQSFYSPNYFISFMPFVFIIVVFIAFIFTYKYYNDSINQL